ncbi:MAG TPA: hypothetical protein VJR89_00815, partial [Polyangiales bacterium]|nr:hypothetical protein [Polyangiales bacterium]
ELSKLREHDDQARLPLRAPGFGRATLFAGAALTLLAFLCPVLRLSGQLDVQNSMLTLARGRAPHLWMVPAVALAVLSVLLRRRTPAGMRGARLALCLLAPVPSAVVAFTVTGAGEAAQLMAERLGAAVHVHWGVGVWVTWVAGVLLLWGALRFGVPAARRVR